MRVLKANTEQYNLFNGYTNANSVLQFVEDNNGNWILGKSVLTDNAFIEIREQLKQLEEIDFNPKVEDVEI